MYVQEAKGLIIRYAICECSCRQIIFCISTENVLIFVIMSRSGLKFCNPTSIGGKATVERYTEKLSMWEYKQRVIQS